jgi:Putative bacterial sensory transduction regulator
MIMATIAKWIDVRLLAAAALVTAGLGTSSAFADDVTLITGQDTDQMIAALEKADFKVKLSEDDQGDPLIESTDDNEPFTVHFYRCNDHHKCDAIQFVSGWNLTDGFTLAKIENWNQNKVWGQAYRDDKNDPWIALAVNLKGGVSEENFADTVDGWRNIMRDFEKHIGWTK